MARGFDSKSVTDQQDELERRRERQQSDTQKPIVSARRRQLELARVDLVHRLETASGPYRETLERGLTALDAELARQKEPVGEDR